MIPLLVGALHVGRIVLPHIVRGIIFEEAVNFVRHVFTKAPKVTIPAEEATPQGLASADNPAIDPPSSKAVPDSALNEILERLTKLEKQDVSFIHEMSDFKASFGPVVRDLDAVESAINGIGEYLSALMKTSDRPGVANYLSALAYSSYRTSVAMAGIHDKLVLFVDMYGGSKKEKEEEENEGEGSGVANSNLDLSLIRPKNNAERIALAQAKLIERQGKTLEKVAPAIEKLGEYFTAKVNGEVEGMNALDLELSHAYTRYKLDEEKLQKYTVNDKEYSLTQLEVMQRASAIAPLYALNGARVSLNELEAMSKVHHLTKQSIKIGEQTFELSPADVAAEKNYQLAIPYASDMSTLNTWSASSTATPALSAIQAQKLKDTIDAKEKYTEANFDFGDLLDTELPDWSEVKDLFKFRPLSAQIEEVKKRGV